MTTWNLSPVCRVRVMWSLAAAVVCCLLPAAPAHAATRTWTGAVSNLWSVAGNWAENTVPVAGDDLVFGGLTPNMTTLNDLAAGTSFNSLSFTSEAYTLQGNAITLGAGGIIQNANTTTTSTQIQLANVVASARPVQFSGSALGVLQLQGIVSGGGGLDVTNTATSNRTLYLSNANTFGGGISLTDINVELQHDSGFGTGTVTNVDSRIVMNHHTVANALEVEGCGLSSNSAAIDHIGVWSGAVSVTGDVCLGQFGGTLLFSGPLTGTHRINAARHSATLVTFSADSPAFSGELAVLEGTVRVSGDFGAAPADLTSSLPGATLAGTGRTGSAAVTAAGARLAPGISPGIFSTGHLTMQAGAHLDIELNGVAPGTGYDQVSVTGQTSLSGATLNVALGFAPPAGTQFTIIDNDDADAVVGTFAGRAEGATFNVGGTTFQVSYEGGDGNDVVLTVTQQVPTLPFTLFVLLAGALLALGWRAARLPRLA